MTPSKRVLVTRAAQRGSELAERLRTHGLDPVLIPAIATADPSTFEPLNAAMSRLSAFDWLIFTSANAVAPFAERYSGRYAGRIAAIGSATARALATAGLVPDLLPEQAVAEALTYALLPYARRPDETPTRFLLVRAEDARELLPQSLRAAGAEVTVAPAYRTVIPEESVNRLRSLLRDENASLAAITFTSSSTVRNLLALCEAARVALPDEALRVSIGPITSATLREVGLPPHAEAPEATVASLAETVQTCLREQ